MRKAQAKKLPLAPDPRFNDKLVTRFVNNLMWEGKRVARSLFSMQPWRKWPSKLVKMDMKFGKKPLRT